MKDKITVTVQVTAKDMFSFMLQHTYKSFGGVFGLVFSFAALGLLIKTWGSVNPSYLVMLGVCSLLFTVINPWMIFTRARKQVKRNPGVCEPITYTFEEESFTMEQKGQRVSAPYESLYQVKNGRYYLYLYGNRVRANILPKRQLDGCQDEIVKLVRRGRS